MYVLSQRHPVWVTENRVGPCNSAHEAQINFGILTPYLTYAWSRNSHAWAPLKLLLRATHTFLSRVEVSSPLLIVIGRIFRFTCPGLITLASRLNLLADIFLKLFLVVSLAVNFFPWSVLLSFSYPFSFIFPIVSLLHSSFLSKEAASATTR